MADEKLSPEVVVGQRLHRDDLIGHLKRKGGWVELRLAEEFDPARVAETPLWKDPRSVPGEFMRPDRFGEAEKADAIARLGPAGYEGQHNQDPWEVEGTWFDRAKVKLIPCPPAGTVAVRYWDTAASEGRAACHTAGVLIGRLPDGKFVVIDVVKGRWGPLERNQAIVNTAHLDRRRVGGVRVRETWVEQEPGGSGLEAAQTLIRELAGFNAKADKVTGNKDERAKPFAAQWQAGNVVLVEASWTEEYLAELGTIPGGGSVTAPTPRPGRSTS
jgi:predicted phage terminase large subunit-like protein